METQKDKTISDQGNEIAKLNKELNQSKKSLDDAKEKLEEKDGLIESLADKKHQYKRYC